MLDRHLPYFIAAILAFNIQLAYAVPAQETCHPASKQEITALFDRWNTTLGTGNSDTVTNNYADDAVLLPTLSNQPRTTHAEIKSYFNEFLAKHPHGTILSRNVVVQCNTAYDVGTYKFDLVDKGQKKTVAARYSFIYTYKNGKWLIAHHHSSLMPEGDKTKTN